MLALLFSGHSCVNGLIFIFGLTCIFKFYVEQVLLPWAQREVASKPAWPRPGRLEGSSLSLQLLP